jgi:hypothetical protein
MSNDNTIRTFTAIDIERYHKGQLSAREMHAIEKAALDDPFLADALEGYAAPGVNAAADMADLKKRLEERSSRAKIIPIGASRKSFPWLRAAAMFVLVAGSGFLIYKIGFSDKKDQSIAQVPLENKTVVADSTPSPTDSSAGRGASNSNSNAYSIPGQEIQRHDSLSANKGDVAIQQPELKDEFANYDANVNTEKQLLEKTSLGYKVPDTKGTAAPAPKNNEFAAIAPQKAEENKSFSKAIVPGKKSTDDYYRRRADSLFAKSKDKDGDGIKDSADYEGYYKTSVASSQKRQANTAGLFKENNQARPNLFRGRVTDAYDNALPFANITNTADNVGTYSDAKGNFTLISPDSVLNVQIRSVGFENSNTQLQSTLRDNQVVMQEDNRSLSEVIVSNKAANTNRSRNNTLVHEEPEPVDGWVNYDIYIANNLNVPDTLRRKPTFNSGQVELSFDVNKDGQPVNITVDKSLCDSCDKEAIRLLKQGPKWKHKSSRKKRTSVTISF